MVWKRLILICCALAVILAVPIHSSAADANLSGTIPLEYVSYFRDILSKVSPLDDYVLFRSGEGSYTMVVGDLYYSGTTIVGVGDCTLYNIFKIAASEDTFIDHFSTSLSNGYTLNLNGLFVYSNLGSYPDLYSRSDYFETAILLLLLIIVFMSLVSRIFNFNLRYKR